MGLNHRNGAIRTLSATNPQGPLETSMQIKVATEGPLNRFSVSDASEHSYSHSLTGN